MRRPESELKLFECSCASEMISIEHFDGSPEIYLSVWYRGGMSLPLGWRDKLRYCWRVMTTGAPFADQIILDKETAIELADHINEIANK